MRRIASHYVYWKQFYRMHYVELDDCGLLTGVFPLEGEIAGTEFYDGILIPVSARETQKNIRAQEEMVFDLQPEETLAEALGRQGFIDIPEAGSPACLLLLGGVSYAAAKFGTGDSCCNGYIKRF